MTAVEPAPDLAALRRDLCRTLRQYRLAAGLTQEQAAAALEWSASKFIRVEHGATTVRVTDVQAMLRLYGITDQDETDRLTAAARCTWLRTEATRTRIPFGKLMDLAAGAPWPFTFEELADRWEEPPQRIADAFEAVTGEVRGGRQRLVFDPDMNIWKCAGCGCGLVEGILAHHYDCTEVTVPRPAA